METFLFCIAAYLIGSIPVAYLVVQKKHRRDLRTEGSKNIGSRNAFEVTGDKQTGYLILILDMLKGAVPLFILSISGYCLIIPFAAVTIVLGHCYPIWLRFHGGRGLATAAAITLLMSPDILLCWLILYFVCGFIKKQVHIQAFTAIIGTMLFELLAYKSPLFFNTHFICIGNNELLHYSMLGILFIAMTRHIHPLYELIHKKTS